MLSYSKPQENDDKLEKANKIKRGKDMQIV